MQTKINLFFSLKALCVLLKEIKVVTKENI